MSCQASFAASYFIFPTDLSIPAQCLSAIEIDEFHYFSLIRYAICSGQYCWRPEHQSIVQKVGVSAS